MSALAFQPSTPLPGIPGYVPLHPDDWSQLSRSPRWRGLADRVHAIQQGPPGKPYLLKEYGLWWVIDRGPGSPKPPMPFVDLRAAVTHAGRLLWRRRGGRV